MTSPPQRTVIIIRCENEIKWTMHHIILYTDVSSILLCTTHAETMDQGFINCVKTNCCKLLGDFSAGQYEPASSTIKLLANAISVLYVHISQGEGKKKKVLHLESGNVATKQNCLSVI